MNIKFCKEIQDGKLDYDVGRIVMMEGLGFKSTGPGLDHNDCLRAFARKYGLHKDDTISNAHRYYYCKRGKDIIVCPVRKIDEDYYDYCRGEFEETINDLFNL